MNALQELITAHKAAVAAFEDACDVLEETQEAYDAAVKDNQIKVELYDIKACAIEGREWLRAHADDVIDRCRRPVPIIKNLSPEFADAFDDFTAKAKQYLYDQIDAALAEEQARQEAFGLASAQHDWELLSDAERETLLAICRHRCETIAEERQRLAYVLACPSFAGCGDINEECSKALLQSVGEKVAA